MRNADPRAYGTGGIWPLQHSGYKDRGWLIHTRSAMLAYRVKDRLMDVGDVGQWVYEEDSVGDVVGGNLWPTSGKPGFGGPSRETGAWAFAWPVTIQASVGGGGGGAPPLRPSVATGAGGGDVPAGQTRAGRGGKRISMTALPIGTGGGTDRRFEPKKFICPLVEGKPGDDPSKVKPKAGEQRPGVLYLGIGAQVVPISGGKIGVNYSGVRTNFTGGKPGASFNPPRDPYRAPAGAR